MKNTIRISEEISKNVKARKHITTKIEYYCEDEAASKILSENITNVLTKHLGDMNLAKITYDYVPSEQKIEVEIIEHM